MSSKGRSLNKHLNRYEVGDSVKVVNRELKTHDLIGAIVDIHKDHPYPYEVDFGQQAKDIDEDLFNEIDLVELEGKDVDSEQEAVDYIDIVFQQGDPDLVGVNGAQVEDVIDALVEEVIGHQQEHSCRERAFAIKHLEEAQNWLYRYNVIRKDRQQ